MKRDKHNSDDLNQEMKMHEYPDKMNNILSKIIKQ